MLPKKNILISVVIPVFNGVNFINFAIKSVLNQDYNSFEIIVVNDGSLDGTGDYLDKLKINNLTVIHTENRGQSNAINLGIKSAKGSIVGYLSADDIFHPKLISTVSNEFQRNPKIVCVYPNYNLIDKNGKFIKKVIIPQYDKKNMLEDLFCFPGPGAFFYKSHFMILKGWDRSFSQIPDLEFWIRLSKYGKFKGIDNVHASFRIHEQSGSVKKISFRKSIETIILAKKLMGEGFNSRKINSNAHMIAAFHNLKSNRFLIGIKFILISIISWPKILMSLYTYKLIFKGFLK
jgi:glycosyltransferase involved in cell wall biosynthesis